MVLREGGSDSFNGLLDLESRANCFDRARELGNDAVASAAEYPAFVRTDEPGDQLTAVLLEARGGQCRNCRCRMPPVPPLDGHHEAT
jgi:hypothetical protein